MIEHKLKQVPKAVLFDWDSTLVDSLQIVHDSVNHAFAKHGGPLWTLEETKVKIHQSYRNYIPTIFPNNWQEVIDSYREHYIKISNDLQAFSGADKVLAFLKQNQVYVGLVSNKKSYILKEEVTKFEWDHYFSKILGSGDLDHDKPHPMTVQAALENTNINPNLHPVWFVGDSVTDMETAHNTGCIPVFYGDDNHNDERYAHCRPEISFSDHGELLAHLQKLIKR